MKYTSSELRNNKLALLRRLQRKMDKEKEPIIESKLLKGEPKFDGSGKGIGVNKGRGGCEVIKIKRKNMRLNLLDRRNIF